MSGSFTVGDLESPKRTPLSSPSARFAARSQIQKNDEEQDGAADMQSERKKLERKTQETLSECYKLMGQAHAYAKNTLNREPQSPLSTKSTFLQTEMDATDSYRRSPYGKELHITDYSSYCSPVRRPRPNISAEGSTVSSDVK